MENVAITMVTSVVSSSVVSAAAVWLLRTYISERLRASIQHEYDLKLEAFKAQQESVRHAETERLRSDLHIVATEREITFRGLQERRADVIARVYAALQGAHSSLQLYSDDLRFAEPTDEELLDRLKNNWDELIAHLFPNAIYLPPNLVSGVQKFIQKMALLLRDVSRTREEGGHRSAALNDQLDKRIAELKAALSERLAELESEFRKLLGDGRASAG